MHGCAALLICPFARCASAACAFGLAAAIDSTAGRGAARRPRPFQEVLQSIRYLLNRPLCFRLEREFAGSDFGVAEASPSPTDQPCLGKAHITTSPSELSARRWWAARISTAPTVSGRVSWPRRCTACLMTAKLWKLNPRTWLSAYLQVCADAGKRAPRDIRAFLPWTMSASELVAMRACPLGQRTLVQGWDTS